MHLPGRAGRTASPRESSHERRRRDRSRPPQTDWLRGRDQHCGNGEWRCNEMISDTIDLVDSDIARGRKRTKASAARLLSLAGTPTFAVMALLTAGHGGSLPDTLCSAARDGSPLTGMVAMYLSMSGFHLGPWLRLLSRRRRRASRS